MQHKLSIVLVTFDSAANWTRSVYPVSASAICTTQPDDAYPPRIQHIDIGEKQGDDRPLRIEFLPGSQCAPKTLEIRSSEFQATKAEVHVEPKRKGSVVDPQ